MKACVYLKDEIVPSQVKKKVALGHDSLDREKRSGKLALRNNLECIKAARIFLPYEIHLPGRPVSETSEDSKVIETRCRHQREVCRGLWRLEFKRHDVRRHMFRTDLLTLLC